MLTIHSGINQNLRPVFEGRKDKNRRQEETKNMSEVDRLRKEYENDEERSLWEKQSQGFEEMLSKNEEKIPKQMKTAMRGGAVLAAGVLGGMATGWSAKYIIAAFKDMSKSRVVQNIAEKFNFSYSYLSGYFSQTVKEGFSGYLNRIRIRHAMEYLSGSPLPISQIGEMVGYTEHSYFCRVFKKITSETPSEYRRRMKRG